ncbi:MAG: hypothetical protein ACD_49C00082G0001, partial [uncultured bacterium (gcode 4)]
RRLEMTVRRLEMTEVEVRNNKSRNLKWLIQLIINVYVFTREKSGSCG